MRTEIIGNCTLYHGDAYEIVPTLTKVDLILTDPPYVLSDSPPGDSHYGMSLSKFEDNSYHSLTSGFDFSIFDQLKKICQPFNMFCFCSNRQISSLMAYHEAKKRNTTLLIWHKTNAVPFANGVWRGDIEYIVHAKDSGATFNGDARQKKKVSQYPIVHDLDHPTVKPLSLIKKYLHIGSYNGDNIIDPFMGSGKTLIACAHMQRKGIGIEKEEKYFDLACCRVEESYRQADMLHALESRNHN